MDFSAAEISALLNGEIEGDPQTKVNRLEPIETARAGALSFISNPKYLKYLTKTEASIVLVGKDVNSEGVNATLIRLDDVYTAFSKLLSMLNSTPAADKAGVEEPSFISDKATIGENVYIGAFAYIDEGVELADGAKIFPHTYLGKNVKVGADTVLFSGVKVYPGCKIGSDCILHSGAVIGSDGFGFAPQPDGSFVKMPQTGHVKIGNRVEIGANTVIDRATIDATVIEDGVKLDNLIQIAHNVKIGKNTAVAAQAGISGSSEVGPNCLIGGQAGIVGHIKIAGGSKIGAKAGVGKSLVKEGGSWSGRPVVEHHKSLKIQAASKNLPEMHKEINALKSQIEDLRQRIEDKE